jgi:hypothetical protein
MEATVLRSYSLTISLDALYREVIKGENEF